MKNILLSLLFLIPLFVSAQHKEPIRKFGFVLNSGFNGELYPIRLVPGVTYTKGKNKIELGTGFHPYLKQKQRLVSGEMNYKYFPNGMANKLNMYLVGRFSYVNNKRDTYFPTTYNYLFLNGGYGFEINAFTGVYLGTNVSAGGFTYSKNSENPYLSYSKNKMFDNSGLNLAFQFNIGYRL
ncbi:MAG: hypothetical protein GC181_09265 [Bacteroidetes bacterium]|nr:hypothetical protein [Bacteroidota bacterium]